MSQCSNLSKSLIVDAPSSKSENCLVIWKPTLIQFALDGIHMKAIDAVGPNSNRRRPIVGLVESFGPLFKHRRKVNSQASAAAEPTYIAQANGSLS